MVLNNPYKPGNITLERRKSLIWIFSLVGYGIYTLIVLGVLLVEQIPQLVKVIVVFSYMFIGPIIVLTIWLLAYIWKSNKWPQNEIMFGSHKHFMLLILLMGTCVITWVAYWNTGIDSFWLILANIIYYLTDNIYLASIIYYIGATAITPALVEEFFKSLPCILAFFVVLKRNRNSEQKGKGMLGNELQGFLIGLLIGITFESIETAHYLVFVISSGGDLFDIYIQVAVRSWAPIHVLGGALGGYAAGKAERLRFENNEENLPMSNQIKKFIKRFVPIWLIPVSMHFLWNSSFVWLLIIYMYTNDLELVNLLQFIMLTVLSITTFVLLLVFLRKANKSAQKTERCPETGIIVRSEDVICEAIRQQIPFQRAEPILIKHSYSYCPTCGNPNTGNDRFCRNCGYKLEITAPFKHITQPTKLYSGFTTITFIFTIISAVLLLIFSIGFFGLVVSMYGVRGIFLTFLLTSIEIITGVTMICVSIKLLKLRKNYNGRDSIWGWLIIIFNLIGWIGILIIGGIYFLIVGIIYLLSGSISLAIPFAIIFLFGGVSLSAFLLLSFKDGKQPFQYQRLI